MKLSLGGQDYSQKVTVMKDPHSTGTEADIAKQNELLTALQTEMNMVASAANQIETLRAQLQNLGRELGNDETATQVRTAANNLAMKLIDVESQVLQLKATGRGQDDVRFAPALISKLGYLAAQVGGSDYPPTTQAVAVQQELKTRGDKFQQDLQQVLTKDLAEFNAMLKEKNIPNIITSAPRRQQGGE